MLGFHLCENAAVQPEHRIFERQERLCLASYHRRERSFELVWATRLHNSQLDAYKSDPNSLDTVFATTTMTAAKEAGHGRQAAEVHDSWQ